MGKQWIKRELEKMAGQPGTVGQSLAALGINCKVSRFYGLMRRGRTIKQAIDHIQRPCTAERVMMAVEGGANTCPKVAKKVGITPNLALRHLNNLMLAGKVECEARKPPYKYSAKR